MKRISQMMTAAALLALLPSLRSGAQELKSVYFLDNYVYKYELNPAMHDEQTTKVFVGFVLNDIGISAKGNVGVNNFLFPTRDGSFVYFMNPDVSSAQFMDALPAAGATVNGGVNLSLLSFGFKVGPHGFLSFDTRMHTRFNAHASKDFFGQLMDIKDGGGLSTLAGTEYAFQSVGFGADAYLEQAIGYSFKVAEGLRLGVTLKGLIGMTSAQANLDNVNVYFVEDDVPKVNATANMYAASEFLAFPKTGNVVDLLSPTYGKVGISGYGGAADLGISWESKFGLSVSAAVLDLGGMAWKKGLNGQATLVNEIIDKKPKEMDEKEYANRIANKVFDIKTTPVTQFGMLPATFNAGIRYKMPFYQGLSVGVYGDYQLFTGNFDIRGALTISPCRWFSLTANYGWTNFGGTFGAAMNLRPGPFTFFVGAETAFYNFDYGLPFGKVNTTAKLGILISVKTPKA